MPGTAPPSRCRSLNGPFWPMAAIARRPRRRAPARQPPVGTVDVATLLTVFSSTKRAQRLQHKGDKCICFTSPLPQIRHRTKTALGGVLSPKGRDFPRPTSSGIPAPRCSRRETPINRTRHDLAGRNGVKAILALIAGGQAGSRGKDRGAWRAGERHKVHKIARHSDHRVDQQLQARPARLRDQILPRSGKRSLLRIPLLLSCLLRLSVI